MKFRVVWKIGIDEGHGQWFRDRDLVTAWVEKGNAEWGAGTHWLERAT